MYSGFACQLSTSAGSSAVCRNLVVPLEISLLCSDTSGHTMHLSLQCLVGMTTPLLHRQNYKFREFYLCVFPSVPPTHTHTQWFVGFLAGIMVGTSSSCRFLTDARTGGKQQCDVKWICGRRGVISTLVTFYFRLLFTASLMVSYVSWIDSRKKRWERIILRILEVLGGLRHLGLALKML